MIHISSRDRPLRLAILGVNAARIWHMTTKERIIRMAHAQDLVVVDDWTNADLIADARYAFDLAWLKYVIGHPGTVLTLQGMPVLAHVRDKKQAGHIVKDKSLPADLSIIAIESHPSLPNPQLRKREAPFAIEVTAENVRAVERASYVGAYKGVTDLLTLYLWPEWALALTRGASAIRLTPNMVTAIGLAFCIATTFAFLDGHYWIGMCTGLIFMVLDTVDGKLARCTITSSRIGNIFDHGIDLIHPPIWWWAWAMGLEVAGRPMPPDMLDITLIAIVAAYVAQRLIEGAFIALFGMHIHVWQPIDSRFRLITARRNPNMLLLFLFLCIGRPDWGLIALAIWSVLSCLFHTGRLLQAWASAFLGKPVASWLG